MSNGLYTIRTVGTPLTSYKLTLLLTDISDNRIVELTHPQSNVVDPVIPTNLPANTIDNSFYNLSDGNDSIDLNTIPQTANIPIRGLSGSDYIRGISTGNNNINGNQGSDTIIGGQGNDYLRGGKGDDLILGYDGTKFVDYGGSNDTLNGNDGDDTVTGGFGNSLLRGGKGDDVIYSGIHGNDTLIGDLGQDLLLAPSYNDLNLIGLDRRHPQPGANVSPPMPDVYVLRGGDAVAPSLDKADVIFGFNFSRGDRIGLANGITFDNLSFKLVELSLQNTLPPNFFGDSNGFIPLVSTAIQVGDDGSYLGMVYGGLPTDFNRSLFVDASSILAQG